MKNVLIALALGGSVLAPAALADETFNIEFDYKAAEFETAEGTKALYDRLQNQIRAACDVTSSRKGVKFQQMENQCVAKTTEDALKAISSPVLTAHYDQSSGRVSG
ncbi:MAG: hypothetical protein CMK07_02980 [Ponticaulis sp.]|nr:hypothetical protein [Ponticaulis sp.]